jgi:hypothetical protein
MTMNYMDYTDDRGMYMFSNGQNQEWLQFFQVEQEQVSDIILNFIKGGDSINHLFLFILKVFLKITPLLSIYFIEFSLLFFLSIKFRLLYNFKYKSKMKKYSNYLK